MSHEQEQSDWHLDNAQGHINVQPGEADPQMIQLAIAEALCSIASSMLRIDKTLDRVENSIRQRR